MWFMRTTTSQNRSLRERTRESMRNEVVAVAFRLFTDRGFDAVTTTEIAREAGISPRSFFRYFPTKEDVVLSGLNDSGHLVRDALAGRPRQEPAWEALGHALQVLATQPSYRTDDLETMTRIIMETPSIRARDLEKYQQWEDLLVPGIAERLTDTTGVSSAHIEDQARALVGAAMACLRIATNRCLESKGAQDPIEILMELLDTVRTT